ncbi:adenylate cyclase regulatory protein [Carex littledalei]|uniref:Adenylate cyclase regulatory protein n=1 Tax=Carex littledalei TaxID=544730 RepID=A0A833VIH1_9POAL|nr:adenylate cyclase regulatory protein [Carex littledalei]
MDPVSITFTAVGWLMKPLVEKAVAALLEAWAKRTGLGDDFKTLKKQLVQLHTLLTSARGLPTNNSSLKDLALELQQLVNKAENLLDELDYYRLEDQIQQTGNQEKVNCSNKSSAASSSSGFQLASRSILSILKGMSCCSAQDVQGCENRINLSQRMKDLAEQLQKSEEKVRKAVETESQVITVRNTEIKMAENEEAIVKVLECLEGENLSTIFNLDTLPSLISCSILDLLTKSKFLRAVRLDLCGPVQLHNCNFQNFVSLRTGIIRSTLYRKARQELSLCLDQSSSFKVVEVLALQELSSLRSLEISHIPSLESFHELSSLSFLAISHISSMESFHENLVIPHLHTLEISHIPSLESLDLHSFVALEELVIEECQSLTSLTFGDQLVRLRNLEIVSCKTLSSIKGLKSWVNLKELHFRKCPGFIAAWDSASKEIERTEPDFSLSLWEINGDSLALLTLPICKQLTSLEYFYLEVSAFTEEHEVSPQLLTSIDFDLFPSLKELQISFPHIDYLPTSSCTEITDECKKLRNIKEVHFDDLPLKPSIMDPLSIAAIGWLMSALVSKAVTALLEAWAKRIGLGIEFKILKDQLRKLGALLKSARRLETENSYLDDLVQELQQLAYRAENLLDELDYYRLQDEIQHRGT